MLGDLQKKALRHVQVTQPLPRRWTFPDFLIVGPQRTGTTWLHAQLRFHPEILLSEPKEIFFFSRLKTKDSPKFQSAELAWYLPFFREPLWRRVWKTANCLWRSRSWYRPRVRGEATASYAALDEDVIREIVLLNPDIRVILMIRDPVERAWSHAKKDLVRNRKRASEDVSPEEFEAFLADDYQRRCADYVGNLDRWGRHLRAGHLFVGLFDDVATRPRELLLEVMEFLGVRTDARFIPADVAEAVNPAGGSRIPPRFRAFLETLLAREIHELEERYGLRWPPPSEGPARHSFLYQPPSAD